MKKALELVKEFVSKHGCERITGRVKYRKFHLGPWVWARRTAYRRGTLPEWLKRELESLPGWTWHPKEDLQRSKLKLLQEYLRERGWDAFDWSTDFQGVHLGSWVHGCRKSFAKGTLPEWLQAELENIPGWTWTSVKRVRFGRRDEQAIQVLRRFVAEQGWGNYRTNTVFEGTTIGRYGRKWRAAYRLHQLTADQVQELESIPGWSWDSHYPEERHRWVLTLLRDCVAEHGWQGVTGDTRVEDVNLGRWCLSRRVDYKNGKLADWLRQELEAIPGWRWSGRLGVPSEESGG